MAKRKQSDAISETLAAPVKLRCEYLVNPLGIDVRQPRFSWQLVSGRRGARQTAYQVLVASTPDQLATGKGDKWDSGKVASDETIQIEYAGRPLASRERVLWAVRSWDQDGKVTPWSAPATFEMGLLEAQDWQGQWIGAAEAIADEPAGRRRSQHGAQWIGAEETIAGPLLRKTFRADRPIAQARVYICGLGYYELRLNGGKVGDHVLDPNWTDYDHREMRDLLYPFDDQTSKRVLYVTYDVTGLLRAGDNAVGVMLGNGWYNQRDRTAEGQLWYGSPRLLLQLEITYADGSREVIASDESWRCAGGPITHDNIFYGEVYDARLEQPRWDEPGFDDSRWAPAQVMRAPAGRLQAQLSPPDKVIRTAAPIALTEPQPGVFVYDFGENTTGWVRLRVQGQAGRQVTLRFAGELDAEGMLDFRRAGSVKQIQRDVYILKGGEPEECEPRFTWHGFRYVELTGSPGVPSLETLERRVVHSALESAGEFACSNQLINAIQDNYLRTQLANYHGCVPSDCPHRERLGYTGDGHVTANAAMLNFAAAQLYTKWLGDISDGQNQSSGFVPHTAPFYGGGGGPGWGAGYVIVAWQMYQHYGDRRLLETHYPGLHHWMEYLSKCTDEDGVVVREEPGSWCLGDWSFPVRTGIAEDETKLPPPLVNTYFYGVCAGLMGRIARVLGREDDARAYAALEDSLKQVFHRRFFDDACGCYSIGRHGAEAYALALGAAPDDQRPRVLDHLLRNIAEHGGHFDTGIFGTPLVLQALTDSGHTEKVYQMLAETTYPSFGYSVVMGATTLWEDWEEDKGSNCHPMFGSFSAWLYRVLAGISDDAAAPGFKALTIEPHVVGDLTWVRAALETIRGRVAVEWRRRADSFRMDVAIPTGATAVVHVPTLGYANPTVRESAHVIWRDGAHRAGSPGVSAAALDDDAVVVHITGGRYTFEVSAAATEGHN